MTGLLDVDDAMEELRTQTMQDIERTTALTWGGRAAAAFRLAREAADAETRRRWLMDAENYRQEAIEHAAMTEDLDLLRRLMQEIDRGRSTTLAEAATR